MAKARKHCEVTRHTSFPSTLESIFRVNSSKLSIGIPTRSVVNMDEINIRFDAVPTVTLRNRGTRTVRVSSTGNASWCTVILAVSIYGT